MTWQTILALQFSDPCYLADNLTVKNHLDNWLAGAHHGRQHGEGMVRFTRKGSVVTGLDVEIGDEGVIHFPIADLNSFGYVVTPGMTPDAFLDEYWN